MHRRKIIAGYLMLLPMLAGLLAFNIYPFFSNLYFSMTDIGSLREYSFVGLENYREIFSDADTLQAFRNTLAYIVIVVPSVMAISLGLALLLSRKIRFRNLYRVLIFLPAVSMPIANAMIWKWLFHHEFGMFNHLLGRIGLGPVSFLGDERWVFWSCALVLVWGGLALNVVILLAGIQDIPKSLYEAAEVDGASAWRSFAHITLPMLSPTLFFLLVINVIGVSQVFDEIYLLLGQRNLVESQAASAIHAFYKHAFVSFEQGYAAAIAVLVFLFTFAITMVQLRVQKLWVHYEAE